MSRRLPLHLAVLFLIYFASAGGCYAFTLNDLQGMLQSVPTAQSVPFLEVRESPWLAAPIESRGTLHSKSDRLEKRVEEPRRETWLILADRLEWEGSDGAGNKQILFSGAPAIAALAEALRSVIAGDLVSLESKFRIDVRGDEKVWTAQLLPRSQEVARSIDYLELRGVGGQLQVIIIAERQGDRTTTRLRPQPQGR